MVAFAALFAVLSLFVSAQATCSMQSLCFELDELHRTSQNSYLLLQILENKIDSLDVKLDYILLSTRLHSTLLFIDLSKFDVSEVYEERIYLASKVEAPFDISAANKECKRQGGYLLELDDNKERDFTYEFVKKIGGSDRFAAGGNDIATEGTWLYYNSGKPVPSGLTWLPGEPNNAGGNEDCMIFWMSRGGLNDIPCNLSIKYVCEVPLRRV